jgi:hypothetical protein
MRVNSGFTKLSPNTLYHKASTFPLSAGFYFDALHYTWSSFAIFKRGITRYPVLYLHSLFARLSTPRIVIITLAPTVEIFQLYNQNNNTLVVL